MNLCVVIPAYREGATIQEVIKRIPRQMAGVTQVTVLVVDDGSDDMTAACAREAGADLVVIHKRRLGLGQALNTGFERAIELGADLAVHLDADGQYQPEEIPRLIQPILAQTADIVLGSRFAGRIERMSALRRAGNRFFTFIVRMLSGVSMSDAQTGFRALSADAVMRLYFLAPYTYTQEMIIQAAHKHLTIREVPCTFTVRQHGTSRLVHSVWAYGMTCLLIVLRTYRDYKPLKFFGVIGLALLMSGFASGSFILYHFVTTGKVSPHIPLALLTVALVLLGVQVVIFAFLADMASNMRKVLDKILYEARKAAHG